MSVHRFEIVPCVERRDAPATDMLAWRLEQIVPPEYYPKRWWHKTAIRRHDGYRRTMGHFATIEDAEAAVEHLTRRPWTMEVVQ